VTQAATPPAHLVAIAMGRVSLGHALRSGAPSKPIVRWGHRRRPLLRLARYFALGFVCAAALPVGLALAIYGPR